MKTLVSILLLSSLVYAPLLVAGADLTASPNKSAVIENLASGIQSDNEGLRVSSAIVMTEVIENALVKPGDFSSTLIPLLRMLDYGATDEERIAAAVALYSIDSGIGIYRLRGSAKFDSSEKVRAVSKNLYYSYHTINHSTYFLDF
jgi:hypothetical protein